MSIQLKRSPSFYVPGFNQNAVIKLIIYCGVAFVSLYAIQSIMLIIGYNLNDFDNWFVSNVALPSVGNYAHKFWTPLVYYWFNKGFWNLFTDMVWLYCFGSLVQMLIGYKQVIPIFIYSSIAGGIFYLLGQFVPGVEAHGTYIGPVAGLTGLAGAAITLSPRYRFFFTDRFSVPLLLIAGIFVFLMILHTGFQPTLLLLMVGGGLGGFLYIRLLNTGYKPGEWPYNTYSKLEKVFTPDEQALRKKQNKKRSEVLNKMIHAREGKQKRVDDILDKINQKGYTSLTAEEKDILLQAGKENDN